MKKISLLFIILCLLLGTTHSSEAVSINYMSQSSTDGTMTSPYNWAIVSTFNNDLLPSSWACSGNGSLVKGSVSGRYAAPYNNAFMSAPDSTFYLSVPNPVSNGSFKIQLGSTYNYFGLLWGSVDTYNSIAFYDKNVKVASFSGSDITSGNPANGNQSAPYSNLYVNFLDLPVYDSFVLTSTNFAFESDNIAVGNSPVNPVPEPASLFLLGAGLIGLTSPTLRKKIRK